MSKIHVLLSGGVGSRLWPLSKKSRPKQFIPLFEGKTLFQLTAERNINIVDKGIVVVNKENVSNASNDLDQIQLLNCYNTIVEFSPRNTAAAIAFAALSAEPEDLLLITPSDQMIDDNIDYLQAINRAFELAEEDFIVTLGIQPTRAETGYGYIESEREDVLRFCEKPTKSIAESFLQSGNFLWNAGIFCFKAKIFLEELNKFRPDIYQSSLTAWNLRVDNKLPELESLQIPSESIDIAVLEHTSKIKVVPSRFTWSDLGSFESLFDYFTNLGRTNYIINNNLVMCEDLHVEVIGVENLVIVQSGKSLLVLPKSDAQKVKQIYEKLSTSNSNLI